MTPTWDDWASVLKKGLTGISAHPMPWQQADSFNRWASGSHDEALKALRAIWVEDDSPRYRAGSAHSAARFLAP